MAARYHTPMEAVSDINALAALVAAHPKLFVLTGAGCSTGSGIPDYRNDDAQWKRAPPMELKQFLGSAAARQRYWARSFVGWPSFADARPGPAHHALVGLASLGHVHRLVTQNVDGLHSRAGSNAVIDLHGRNDRVRCIECGAISERKQLQRALWQHNPGFRTLTGRAAPDGDADLENVDTTLFRVPACLECGGILRPDVVFFGDGVPRARVEAAYAALESADALLAVGTSLMVYSGFRFCRRAAELDMPIAIVNRGRTRADPLAELKFTDDCGTVLEQLVRALA